MNVSGSTFYRAASDGYTLKLGKILSIGSGVSSSFLLAPKIDA